MSAELSPPPTDNTVGIEIDGVALRAPKGSMIIHAADKAGIAILRFCYHEKLPIAANCRMCLVDVEKAPKPMPACATPVMEGMRVFTQSKRALDSQRNVMEFLLVNHPLDCPICDQGGECELQDVAMGYGRSVSRFSERKRVQADEDMGPLIATDMTRCIHCTRCVRFSTEIAGTYELGGMGRGENLSIGTYIGKSIESELSGNLIDVCPVGALTNKPFRFRARAWELTSRDGIGYHDGMGSNLHMHVRRGEILRCVPRANEPLNESWLSDRDRYSHAGLKAEDRLVEPMLRQDGSWKSVSWETALARVAELLGGKKGAEAGWLVHPSTSQEEVGLLARITQGSAAAGVDYRLNLQDLADRPHAEPFEASLEDIQGADVVILLGCHPRHEAPILGHRVREAWKRGAKVVSLGSVDWDHNVELAASAIAPPSKFLDLVLGLARALGNGQAPAAGLAAAIEAAQQDPRIDALADAVRGAQRAVVLLGETAQRHAQSSWMRALGRYIADSLHGRLNVMWAGANAVGMARSGLVRGADARRMLGGAARSLVLYGVDPEHDFADQTEAFRAIQDAQHVVAFSAFDSAVLRKAADVLLPLALPPEYAARYVNLLDVVQGMQAAAKAPGQARPGWKVLRALGAHMGLPGFDFVEPTLPEQVTVDATPGELARRTQAAPGSLELIESTAIYGVDAVTRRAGPLQAHPLSRGPSLSLSQDDAASLGLADGDTVRVDDARGTASLPLRIDRRVPKGGAWIERGYAATAALAPMGSTVTVSKA